MNRHPIGPVDRPRPGRRGFALLITITLLAFLVLLLVALASLTRVETQVAANNQQLVQARQNALMALNIALGQLQKTAGPDQRVTGTADLASASSNDGARLVSGATLSTTVGATKYWDTSFNGTRPNFSGPTSNGLTAVQAGTRYWTGVWGNSDPSAPTANNGNIYEFPPRPVLLNWLVSGNEGATFTASTSSGTFGQITSPASPTYTPALAVTGLSTGMGATDTVTINGNAAILLVGPASAGTAAHPTTSEPALDRYVVAPLVTLQSSSVPGFSTAQTIGRYGYWVGDEGVKARLNLVDPYYANTAASSDPLARYRLMTAPRTGLEVVSDFSSSGYAATTQSTTAANNIADRVLARNQTPLLDTTNITTAKVAPRFHDLTTHSVGVLADTYNGGLRKDLSYYLEQSTLPNWTDTNGLSAGKDQGIIPSAYSPVNSNLTTTDKRLPRWDLVSSFYKLPSASGNTLTGGSGDTVVVRDATATQMGIAPMVVQIRMLGGAAANATSTASTTTSDVPSLAGKSHRQMLNVIIVLANPYPVTLSAPQGINVKFNNDIRLSSSNNIGLYDFAVSTGSAGIGWLSDVIGGNITLSIPAFTLSKGGAAAFYISGQQKVVSGTASTVPLVQLTTSNPPNSAGTSLKDYVYCDYSWSSASSSSTISRIRLSETGGNSPLVAEFSLPGSSQLLMQVGGINLDRSTSSGEGYTSADYFNPQSTVANYPVFGFQVYYNEAGDLYQPSVGSLGMGNTALRTWVDFNPRAGYYRVTNYSFQSAPYIQFYTPKSTLLSDFSTGLATLYWGRSIGMLTSMSSATVSKANFFDLPRKSSSSSTEPPFQSLAALQHANLAAEDIPSTSTSSGYPDGPQASGNTYTPKNDYTWKFGTSSTVAPNPGHQPAYAFANSYASIFLPRAKAVFTPDTTNYPYQLDCWNWSNGSAYQNPRKYYDISYLLNNALWDGYFLSSIPQSSSASAYDPVNPRLALRSDVTTGATLVRDGAAAAKYTVVKGAFNINSTSVDAWTAVLAGMKNLPKIPGLSASGSNSATVFPRSLWQTADAISPPTGTGDDSYSGYRQLSDTDVQNFAAQIVKQVRMRGPFLSLAQFVNRVLVSASSSGETTCGLGQSGALQSAIDLAALNAFSNSSASTANDKGVIPTAEDSAILGGDTNSRGTYSLYADGANAGLPNQLSRSAGIPGWLTQADVLQAIGPVVAARSDTFVIRAYGDVMNPVVSTTAPVARAWCEAVVQRMPDYVDATANSAEIAPSSASSNNQTFGRRFRIVSFRWLSPNDI